MDAEEKEICTYLKSWSQQFVSAREICRRAGGKRRYRDDPHWAMPFLARLVDKKLVESDATGHYRLRQKEKKKKDKKWVSPEIQQILEKSSKDFSQVFDLEDMEDSAEI